jgi:hypothetical protein
MRHSLSFLRRKPEHYGPIMNELVARGLVELDVYWA